MARSRHSRELDDLPAVSADRHGDIDRSQELKAAEAGRDHRVASQYALTRMKLYAADPMVLRHQPDHLRAPATAPASAGVLTWMTKLSTTINWGEVMQKLREYFAVGVQLVWVADPAERRMYAYRALNDMREFGADDELPGDDVLPGFAIPVARLFEA